MLYINYIFRNSVPPTLWIKLCFQLRPHPWSYPSFVLLWDFLPVSFKVKSPLGLLIQFLKWLTSLSSLCGNVHYHRATWNRTFLWPECHPYSYMHVKACAWIAHSVAFQYAQLQWQVKTKAQNHTHKIWSCTHHKPAESQNSIKVALTEKL